MPGTITPLPVLDQDQEQDFVPTPVTPTSLVVSYGYLRHIGEFPYDGKERPACGGKVVVRTNRGTELAKVLTTTCANSGCSKAISRKDMLAYFDNSGGKDFPFTNQGRVLRQADADDLREQTRVDSQKPQAIKQAKAYIMEMDVPMALVDVEILLGGERTIFYYTADKWVDFRELVRQLAGNLQTRIEMHQVNARDEARLVADYEKCGQQCCCKQFLKVLKPVSMRSAKVQKATLDPQKISGRCGRLMCCLRYEDQTYTELRKRLPRRKSYVETENGIGIVLDTQILTQLVLVRIEASPSAAPVPPAPPAAYPIEKIRLLSDQEAREFQHQKQQQPNRDVESKRDQPGNKPRPSGRGNGVKNKQFATAQNHAAPPQTPDTPDTPAPPDTSPTDDASDTNDSTTPNNAQQDNATSANHTDSTKKHKRRRRRRRKHRGGGAH